MRKAGMYSVVFWLYLALVVTGCKGTTTNGTTANAFSVSGVVSGLSGTLVLQNNGGDDLSITSNGTFAFASRVPDNTPYSVSIKTEPTGQACIVSNGTGTISGQDVTNVIADCRTAPGTTYQTYKLTASDAQAYEFGYDVATSSDGNTIVVGARAVSAAYIYKWDGVSWSETKLTVSDGLLFGNSVSISSDGNTIVVGAYESTVGNSIHQGAAYVFKWDGSSWQGTKLTASDGMAEDLFGIDVAVSGDGASILVGAWFAHEGSINGPQVARSGFGI